VPLTIAMLTFDRGYTGFVKSSFIITHSHGSRECFKGDEASQWKRPKNSTPRHARTP